MIRLEAFVKIETLAERGVFQKDIAQELGVSDRTVRRALRRGGPPKRAQLPRVSKLEPFKGKVDGLLAAGVWNAAVILRELQSAGYTGSRTLLREYVQPKRALRSGRATVRFETEPGVQTQTDWGQVVTEIGGQATEAHFCVNTLGYSRRFHFWCTDSEDAEHTCEAIQRSFAYFGGVTKDLLLDNQKVAVLEHGRDGVVFQERFLDFTQHMGTRPRACKPYRARTKGKDERMVSYIKHNFFVRYRSFESWDHLNQMAETWLREEADQRMHGTVHEVVAERFERERPALLPLPTQRYDTSYRETRQVQWDGYIDVQANRYSVPVAWMGKPVVVRIGLDGELRVYGDDSLIARYVLRPFSAGWQKVAAHHHDLWAKTLGPRAVVEKRPLAVYADATRAEVSSWS